MTTMLDKAALAICNQMRSHHYLEPIKTLEVVENPYLFRLHVRAALQSIREPSPEMVRAASESAADDGEGGNFGPLFDLLDFSGENKTRLVVAEALRKAVGAILEEKPE